jgi:CubicO group peptidase (beta-lactamase class C family)
MRKRFFEPLGMTSSRILDRWEIVKDGVPVYTIRNGQLAHWRRDSQFEVHSFAGVGSTIEDLTKWEEALYNRTVLKKASLDLMWTQVRLNNGYEANVLGNGYGFGWMLGDHRGHRIAEHSGASGTHIMRFLDDGMTIIVLTNLDGPSGSRAASLARGIAGCVRPEYRTPQMLTPEPDPRPETTLEIRTLIAALAEGNNSPTMSAGYQAFYTSLPRSIRQEDAGLLKALKTLNYITSDEVDGRGLKINEPISRISYYKGEIGERVYYFTIWLTKEGKVARMRFSPQ